MEVGAEGGREFCSKEQSEQEKGSCDNKHGLSAACLAAGTEAGGQLLTSSCEAWPLRALPHGMSLWSFPPCGEENAILNNLQREDGSKHSGRQTE